MQWNLPNILTVMRLLAAPLVALVFVLLPRGMADWVALGLFVAASLTDWLDGWIARRWRMESRFGAMLDPIADKAMVVIALAVVLMLGGRSIWILLPCIVILFREVFVSGLREFLGDVAGALKVTKLAKWKTTVQMAAIAVLLAQGGFEDMAFARSAGMGADFAAAVLSGTEPDVVGLRVAHGAWLWSGWLGGLLLWAAAALTFLTGLDYFRKALPYLKEDH